MSTSKNNAVRREKYALVVGRTIYNATHDALDTLRGVAATVRNVAVDLHRNGFMVVVVADTRVALAQGAFANATVEQHYVDDSRQAKRAGSLRWICGDATRANVRAALAALAAMVPGHVAATADELVIYIAAHGVENASDRSYGAALGECRCVQQTTDAHGKVTAVYEGAYTMEQLHDDLGVDQEEQRWRNTLVVLDTCHSGAAFDMTQPQVVCARRRGVGETPTFQTAYLSESFHCLAHARRVDFPRLTKTLGRCCTRLCGAHGCHLVVTVARLGARAARGRRNGLRSGV